MRRNLLIFGGFIIVLIVAIALFIQGNQTPSTRSKNNQPKEDSKKIYSAPKEKTTPPKNRNNLPLEKQTLPTKHPYGNAVLGSLMWESNGEFLKLQKNLKAEKRMGAFETILPDPLPGEESNVALAADFLANAVVKPGEVFSLSNRIGPFSLAKGYQKGPTYRGNQIVQSVGGGVCKVASTLYNVVTYANLPIVERYAHSMLVPYVPPGQDATISYSGNKDFKFRNNTADPILIWADTKGNTLYIAMYGVQEPPQVRWRHQELDRVKYPSVSRINPKLASGEEKEIIPGADGLTIKSWIEITHSDGHVEIKERGIDHYQPMTRVVETGR